MEDIKNYIKYDFGDNIFVKKKFRFNGSGSLSTSYVRCMLGVLERKYSFDPNE
jgi:hypothetical protein